MREPTANNRKVSVGGVLCVSGNVYPEVRERGRSAVRMLYMLYIRNAKTHSISAWH